MSPSLWKAAEVLEQVRARPVLLEPGLRFDGPPEETETPGGPGLRGRDAAGRRCLVFLEDRIESGFLARLLEALEPEEDGEAGGGGPSPVRVFLLSPVLDPEERRRLQVIGRAAGLRAFSLGLTRDGDGLVPVLTQEMPRGRGDPQAACTGLEKEPRRQVERLLHACQRLRPPIGLRGPEWPLVLVGRQGPCASVHSGQTPLFATGDEVFALDSEAATDRAVDFLMREQWTAEAAGPAPEAA